MRFEAKHGMSRTRLYRVWTNMRDRCNREKDKEYKHYGGKGMILYNKSWHFIHKSFKI